jgi:hypothetical protein
VKSYPGIQIWPYFWLNLDSVKIGQNNGFLDHFFGGQKVEKSQKKSSFIELIHVEPPLLG